MSNFESMMIRLFFLCVAIAVLMDSKAQNDAYGESTVTYSNQYFLGAKLMTSGFGVKGSYGKYNGYKNVKFKSLELLKLKHPKEIRLPSSNGGRSRRFVSGKINAFHTLRLGFGQKRLISDKIRKGAMAIGYSYEVGPSIGLLKPVYVEFSSEGVSAERFDPEIHDEGDISGRSSFFKGIFETKIKPGIYTSCSVLFEFSTERDGIQQLEVGGSLDVFTEKIPILAKTQEKQFYLNLFLTYSLGKKYNKI